MSIKIKNNFNPRRAERKVKAAIGLYAQTAAKKMEADAKRNAPWQDRTGAARNSLLGDFAWRNYNAVITLSGNMDYSVYLELAHEKRFAILKPTIDKFTPEVLKGYQRLVG